MDKLWYLWMGEAMKCRDLEMATTCGAKSWGPIRIDLAQQMLTHSGPGPLLGAGDT